MMKQKLEIYRADTKNFTFTVEEDDVAKSIQGWTFLLTAKANLSQEDAAADFQVDNADFQIIDAPTGQGAFTIEEEKTSSLSPITATVLQFDVMGIDATSKPHTVAVGTITVKPHPTRDATP